MNAIYILLRRTLQVPGHGPNETGTTRIYVLYSTAVILITWPRQLWAWHKTSLMPRPMADKWLSSLGLGMRLMYVYILFQWLR